MQPKIIRSKELQENAYGDTKVTDIFNLKEIVSIAKAKKSEMM